MFSLESVPAGESYIMTTNENQPQPPVDPAASTESLPETSPETSPDTVAVDESAQPATTTKARLQKNAPWLIGAGAAVAVLLLGGGGMAIGAALADNDRDDSSVSGGEHRSSEHRDGDGERADSSEDTDDNTDRTDDRGDDREGDREGDSGSASGSATGAGLAKSDAASLTDAIDAAIAKASGDGASSIEVERGGWSVDVALSDGTEVEVFVAEGGSATVRESDTDRSTDPVIKTSQLSSIIDAAIEGAGGGTVESISTDSGVALYEVSVDLGNGQDVAVELDDKLEVIGVD